MSEPGNKLVEKDTASNGYLERVIMLEKELANVSDEFKRLTTEHTVDKDMHHGVRTVLAPQDTTSQQRATAAVKDREELLADKAAVDSQFRKFRQYMQSRVDRIHVSLDREMVDASDLDGERARLLISVNSLKHQRQFSSKNGRELEDLNY